jgi:hypothetical protein
MRIASICVCASAFSRFASTMPCRATLPILPSDNIGAIGCGSRSPSPLRSSVISAMPARTASEGDAICTGWAAARRLRQRDGAAVLRIGTVNQPHQLRAPAPIRPLMPKISPARTSNDTSRTTLPRVSLSTSAAGAPMLRTPRSIRSPSSRPTINVTISSLVRLAIASTCTSRRRAARRSLGDPRELFEPVRDVDERHAARLQPVDLLEQQIDFARGQHRGGFVEDQHAAVADQIARDFHHLLMADAELADQRVGIDRVEADLRHGVTRASRSLRRSIQPKLNAPIRGKRFRNRFSATDKVGSRFSSCITMRTPSASASVRLAGAIRRAAELHRAGGRVDQAADDLGQRALACAILARQRQHFAGASATTMSASTGSA